MMFVMRRGLDAPVWDDATAASELDALVQHVTTRATTWCFGTPISSPRARG